MYKDFKVVANSAVGRRRYLKLLIPQVLASDIVDRYDLWVNTTDKLDIEFFRELAKRYPKINLLWHPTGDIRGVVSMADFYEHCKDEDTIYIKLDDDVVWLDPSFFEELCRFRVENPDYFLVSPLVINNGICNYILQDKGLLPTNEYLSCQGYDLTNYNGYLAEQIHRWFLNNYLFTDKYKELYCGENIIAMQRFAINAVAWFGRAFADITPQDIGRDDEEFLTVKYPVKHNLVSCFDCNTIVSHFSFSVQRKYLDHTNILEQYENYLKNNGSDKVKNYLSEIEEILIGIEKNKDQILSQPLPDNYRQGILPKPRYKLIRNTLNNVFKFLRVPENHRNTVVGRYMKIVKADRRYLK